MLPSKSDWAMKLEYDIEFKAKVGAWALDEDCGIVGASTKFKVPSDLVYEWAKGVVLSLTDAFVDDNNLPSRPVARYLKRGRLGCVTGAL